MTQNEEENMITSSLAYIVNADTISAFLEEDWQSAHKSEDPQQWRDAADSLLALTKFLIRTDCYGKEETINELFNDIETLAEVIQHHINVGVKAYLEAQDKEVDQQYQEAKVFFAGMPTSVLLSLMITSITLTIARTVYFIFNLPMTIIGYFGKKLRGLVNWPL